MRHSVPFIASLALAACAGKVDYLRPTSQASPAANVKTVDRSREAVWNAAVPELSKQFFVINNIDKSSGLINISYSGDPEKYIDCGWITSYVKNAQVERTYNFAGAKGQQNYEILNPGVGLFLIDRRMSLEGRVNLVFEELSPTQTKVTANTRYAVQRSQHIRSLSNRNSPQSRTDSISFNSGSSASFPTTADGGAAECVANGALELDILSVIR